MKLTYSTLQRAGRPPVESKNEKIGQPSTGDRLVSPATQEQVRDAPAARKIAQDPPGTQRTAPPAMQALRRAILEGADGLKAQDSAEGMASTSFGASVAQVVQVADGLSARDDTKARPTNSNMVAPPTANDLDDFQYGFLLAHKFQLDTRRPPIGAMRVLLQDILAIRPAQAEADGGEEIARMSRMISGIATAISINADWKNPELALATFRALVDEIQARLGPSVPGEPAQGLDHKHGDAAHPGAPTSDGPTYRQEALLTCLHAAALALPSADMRDRVRATRSLNQGASPATVTASTLAEVKAKRVMGPLGATYQAKELATTPEDGPIEWPVGKYRVADLKALKDIFNALTTSADSARSTGDTDIPPNPDEPLGAIWNGLVGVGLAALSEGFLDGRAEAAASQRMNQEKPALVDAKTSLKAQPVSPAQTELSAPAVRPAGDGTLLQPAAAVFEEPAVQVAAGAGDEQPAAGREVQLAGGPGNAPAAGEVVGKVTASGAGAQVEETADDDGFVELELDDTDTGAGLPAAGYAALGITAALAPGARTSLTLDPGPAPQVMDLAASALSTTIPDDSAGAGSGQASGSGFTELFGRFGNWLKNSVTAIRAAVTPTAGEVRTRPAPGRPGDPKPSRAGPPSEPTDESSSAADLYAFVRSASAEAGVPDLVAALESGQTDIEAGDLDATAEKARTLIESLLVEIRRQMIEYTIESRENDAPAIYSVGSIREKPQFAALASALVNPKIFEEVVSDPDTYVSALLTPDGESVLPEALNVPASQIVARWKHEVRAAKLTY